MYLITYFDVVGVICSFGSYTSANNWETILDEFVEYIKKLLEGYDDIIGFDIEYLGIKIKVISDIVIKGFAKTVQERNEDTIFIDTSTNHNCVFTSIHIAKQI